MIPARTQEKLAMEHPEGTRHQAKIEIAMPLLGEGLPAEAVVATLREKFPAAKDREIRGIVDWCQNKHPTPSSNGAKTFSVRPAARFEARGESGQRKLPPEEAVKRFVNGSTKPLESPIEIPTTGHAELFFQHLYAPGEHLNIVCKFTISETKGKKKANPIGGGSTRTRDEWLAYFSEHGAPASEAGAWFRPNPVMPKGHGRDGAITDADVAAFRFVLLESDQISVRDQILAYARLNLPLAAILTSGGSSVHALLRVDCVSADEYTEFATRVLAALSRFGFDQANKNPSRLSRLPGVTRVIGASEDGTQRLLYLAPDVTPLTEDGLCALEMRVKPPKFEFKSMETAVQTALDTYEEIHRDKGKTGLRTGFPRFDWITGGLKKGWLTIIAGETNSGKTSFVLNLILNVLARDEGVALFSFEMDQQEVMDIAFSRECQINRNRFNNGYFTDPDFVTMGRVSLQLRDYPLYTFDDPLMSITDVSEACERLKADHSLSLIVIDYLQLANVEHYRDSREQQVAYVSRMSKAMAKTMKVPVIAVSQLNEDGKVRESRGIAHDANCIITLKPQDDGMIQAQVVKGRSIPKGTYYFDFEPEVCQFKETGVDDRLKALLPADFDVEQPF